MDLSQIVRVKYEDIKSINDISMSYWGDYGNYSENTYKNVINQNFSFCYKKEGKLLGACLIDKYYIWEIFLIVVHKEYKRMGIGKALLNYCINYCKKQNIANLYLHVATTNQPAINLYTKLGFTIRKNVNNYYYDETDNPEDKNAYLMRLELNQNQNKNKNEIKSKPIKLSKPIKAKKKSNDNCIIN